MLVTSIVTTLNAQPSKSSNLNIAKPVKVIDGKIMPEGYELSLIESRNIESVNVIKPDSTNRVADLIAKYGENAKYGVILIKTKELKFDLIETKPSDETNEKVYQLVEQMPQFPGGDKALVEFIERNLQYPIEQYESSIQGKVIVHFIINSTGKVSNPEILRSLDRGCDKEAIRVIKLLPKFIPGKQNGQNVAVWYTLPVTFKLDSSPKSNVYKEHATSEIIDSTKPLYLIDGRTVTETEANNLDPQKIQKLEVLKDSSATAIYGSRAVKGAVKITTKKQ